MRWESNFGSAAPFAIGVEEELLLVDEDMAARRPCLAGPAPRRARRGGPERRALHLDDRGEVGDLRHGGGGDRHAAGGTPRSARLGKPADRAQGSIRAPRSGEADVRESARYIAIARMLQGILRHPDLRPARPRRDAGSRDGRPRLQRDPNPRAADQRARRELAVLVRGGLRAGQLADGDLPQLSAGRDGTPVRRLRRLLPGHPSGLRSSGSGRLHPHLVGRPDPSGAGDDRGARSRRSVRPAPGRSAGGARPLPGPGRGGARPERDPRQGGAGGIGLPGDSARSAGRSCSTGAEPCRQSSSEAPRAAWPVAGELGCERSSPMWRRCSRMDRARIYTGRPCGGRDGGASRLAMRAKRTGPAAQPSPRRAHLSRRDGWRSAGRI